MSSLDPNFIIYIIKVNVHTSSRTVITIQETKSILSKQNSVPFTDINAPIDQILDRRTYTPCFSSQCVLLNQLSSIYPFSFLYSFYI